MRIRYSFSSRKTRTIDNHNQHRQDFIRLAKEVVLESDIVLEVLDARFIDDTRNKEIEDFAKENNKHLIFIINKVDLVDLKELKKSGKLEELENYVLVSCKEFTGKKRLRDLIKIELKRQGEKEERDESEILKTNKHGIGNTKFLKTDGKKHVGIFGYPNVGKSSVINMLAGKASAGTSPQSGFTKGIQKVNMTKDITILDSPGIVNVSENPELSSKFIKKHTMIGVRTFDKVKDPEFIVADMMKRFPGVLEEFYAIEAEGDSEILLEELGRRFNFLKKGNNVDVDRTARKILKDWQEGKIRRQSS